jgi:hypothetical protein
MMIFGEVPHPAVTAVIVVTSPSLCGFRVAAAWPPSSPNHDDRHLIVTTIVTLGV